MPWNVFQKQMVSVAACLNASIYKTAVKNSECGWPGFGPLSKVCFVLDSCNIDTLPLFCVLVSYLTANQSLTFDLPFTFSSEYYLYLLCSTFSALITLNCVPRCCFLKVKLSLICPLGFIGWSIVAPTMWWRGPQLNVSWDKSWPVYLKWLLYPKRLIQCHCIPGCILSLPYRLQLYQL